MLLAMAERRFGLADKLARVFPDQRDPTRVVHSLVDMFRARMFGDLLHRDSLSASPACRSPNRDPSDGHGRYWSGIAFCADRLYGTTRKAQRQHPEDHLQLGARDHQRRPEYTGSHTR